MPLEVNAQDVINNLLEQNKQLTFEIAVLQAKLNPSHAQSEQPDTDD